MFRDTVLAGAHGPVQSKAVRRPGGEWLGESNVAIAQVGDGLSGDTKDVMSALLRRTIACSPEER